MEHSLSPPMHRYFMDRAGIDGEYGRIHVQDISDLRSVEDQLRTGSLDGINITAPWKTTIRDYLDSQTEEAETIGAVNTVAARQDGKLHGHNTDKIGFIRALKAHLKQGTIESAAILGAGGSARAVLLGLRDLRSRDIAILNRTLANAERMIGELSPGTEATAGPLTQESLEYHFVGKDLIVNTLPTSARSIFNEFTVPEISGKIYFDLIYAGDPHRVLDKFKDSGWECEDGLDMLIYQGIASLEYWTGTGVDKTVDMPELRSQLLGE